ncbi:MAG: hypothetical protein FWC56_00570 [Phycisphaerae bacterium]|nr:hypothetical protein [Phycisphaerae bacterium]
MIQPLSAINPDDIQRIIVACALLIGAVLVLAAVYWYYRKRYHHDEKLSVGQPWTFEDLRQMRAQGKLTEAEYQALRASLVAAFRSEPTKPRQEGGPNHRPPREKSLLDEHDLLGEDLLDKDTRAFDDDDHASP